MCIPSEDDSQGNNMLTGNVDVAHGGCKSSLGMKMYLNGNGDVTQRECGCDSLGIHILEGDAYLHQECTLLIQGEEI